jgi:hypothetical protein
MLSLNTPYLKLCTTNNIMYIMYCYNYKHSFKKFVIAVYGMFLTTIFL